MGVFSRLVQNEKDYVKELRGKTVLSIMFNGEDNLIIRFTDESEYHFCGKDTNGIVVAKAITEKEKIW
jgi:hypothetical protein